MLYRLAQDRTELSYQGQVQNQTEDEARPDISDRSSAQDRTIFAPRPVNSVPQDRTELSAKPLNEPMKNQGRAHATLIPTISSFRRRPITGLLIAWDRTKLSPGPSSGSSTISVRSREERPSPETGTRRSGTGSTRTLARRHYTRNRSAQSDHPPSPMIIGERC
jgi:hypothetical protein